MITLGVNADTIYYNYYRYDTKPTPKGTYNGETLPSRFKFDLRVVGLVFTLIVDSVAKHHLDDTRVPSLVHSAGVSVGPS